MTVKQLIERLVKIDGEKMCIITDNNVTGHGWCNIEKLDEKESSVEIIMATIPVFNSDR